MSAAGNGRLEAEVLERFPVSAAAVRPPSCWLTHRSLLVILSIPLPGIILMGK